MSISVHKRPFLSINVHSSPRAHARKLVVVIRYKRTTKEVEISRTTKEVVTKTTQYEITQEQAKALAEEYAKKHGLGRDLYGRTYGINVDRVNGSIGFTYSKANWSPQDTSMPIPDAYKVLKFTQEQAVEAAKEAAKAQGLGTGEVTRVVINQAKNQVEFSYWLTSKERWSDLRGAQPIAIPATVKSTVTDVVIKTVPVHTFIPHVTVHDITPKPGATPGVAAAAIASVRSEARADKQEHEYAAVATEAEAA